MQHLSAIEQRMVAEFIRRYKGNETKQPIDNSSLIAGSPMYYYCKACKAFIVSLPEDHLCPAPRYCTPCLKLDEACLLPTAKRMVKSSEQG